MRNFYNRNFILLEFIISILLILALASWIQNFLPPESLNNWFKGIKTDLYSTIAQISGTLLGFIITAVSIVIVLAESKKLDLLRKSEHYPTLYKIFVVTIKYLAFTTGVALIGMVFDRDSSPKYWITYICLFGVVLSIFGLARCIWVLESLIVAVTKKDK